MDGSEIRRRRQAIGLTQQELANLFHVSVCAVNRWELGSLRMGQRHIPKMQQVLAIYERHQAWLRQELATVA